MSPRYGQRDRLEHERQRQVARSKLGRSTKTIAPAHAASRPPASPAMVTGADCPKACQIRPALAVPLLVGLVQLVGKRGARAKDRTDDRDEGDRRLSRLLEEVRRKLPFKSLMTAIKLCETPRKTSCWNTSGSSGWAASAFCSNSRRVPRASPDPGCSRTRRSPPTAKRQRLAQGCPGRCCPRDQAPRRFRPSWVSTSLPRRALARLAGTGPRRSPPRRWPKEGVAGLPAREKATQFTHTLTLGRFGRNVAPTMRV